MKIKLVIIGLLGIVVCGLFSFTSKTATTNSTGEALAKQYCGSCHIYTAPDLLDKKT